MFVFVQLCHEGFHSHTACDVSAVCTAHPVTYHGGKHIVRILPDGKVILIHLTSSADIGYSIK